MKKLFLIALVMLVSISFSFAQLSVNTNGVRAEFSWISKTNQDLGKIDQNKPVTITYQFKNTSKVPLIITNVHPSCGCTGAKYTETPVLPNQIGFVSAIFNAASPGTFSKTVTVKSNAITEDLVLQFQGEVIAQK